MSRFEIYDYFYVTRNACGVLLMAYLAYTLFRARGDIPKRLFIALLVSCMCFGYSNAFYVLLTAQHYFMFLYMPEPVLAIGMGLVFVVEFTGFASFAFAILWLCRRGLTNR